MVEKVPAVQVVQDFCPEVETPVEEPSGQIKHSENPVPDQVNGGHFVQSSIPFENLPGTHAVHEQPPPVTEYPPGHVVQLLDPALEYVPRGQVSQELPAEEK